MRPDPLLMRESLRLFRHVLRRGGETLREALPAGALPRPAGTFVGALLGEAEQFARSMDRVGSAILDGALGEPAARRPSLRGFAEGALGPSAFAAALYRALRVALARLGAGEAFVSEARIRRALAGVAGREAGAALAAALTLALVDARPIWLDEVAALPPRARAAAEPLALFAALLALLAEADAAPDEAVEAALGIAAAIEAEVVEACRARDEARLAALYAEFAPHV